jgi:hypothetical protein
MNRFIAHTLWFTGICLLVLGWRDDNVVLFGIGALLAVLGSSELRDMDQPE